MSPDKPEEDDAFLLNIAASISDGKNVQWAEAESRTADAGDRELVRQLRVLADIATAQSGADAQENEEKSPREQWGHLRITECVGSGAFGEVYRARDLTLDCEVALKLLRKLESGRSDADIIREARLLAKVHHPNVSRVFGAEKHEGRVGVWMEFIRGQNLEQRLDAQGRLGADEAIVVGRDLCRAVAAVHGAGVLHRDLKTRNVMREEGGRIVLADFGTGCEAGRSEGPILCGTPLYMAPELLQGGEATVRSELYSLGVILFHLVTGTYPVTGETLKDIREAHHRGERALLGDLRPDLPRAFVQAIQKAIDPNPMARFASAGQFEQALEPSSAVLPAQQSHRWSPAAVATTAVAAIVLITIGWLIYYLFGPFDVQASLLRIGGEKEEVLPAEASISVGDKLALEFEGSRPLHVYVVSWDENGAVYSLFPMRDSELQNPLSPRVKHRLPGGQRGSQLLWTVTSPGIREHFLIVASRKHLEELEAVIEKLDPPRSDSEPPPDGSLDERGDPLLRGIGGVEKQTAPGSGGRSAEVSKVRQIVSAAEKDRGVWVHEVDLEYAAPSK